MRVILGNIIAIYRRELQSYFVSPMAYLVAGTFWLIAGFLYKEILFNRDEGILAKVAALDIQGQQLGIPVPAIDVPYEFVRGFLGVIGGLLLFVLPMLSMGLYAEERKRGTLELLATSPVTNWAVAVGKLLGVVTFFTTMILPLLVYQAISWNTSSPAFNANIPLLGHLGLILLATAILSLGMFVSSLTDSTVIAAVLTFALSLFLWLIDLIGKGIGGAAGEAIAHLSLLKHYNTLAQGVFDTSSLIMFASYIFLGIYLTAQSIDALRFQRQ